MRKEITLGFSPCPNDTYIFDALVNGKMDTKGYCFKPILADVEELNNWAAQGKLDVTKISYNALGHLTQNYSLLRSGSALGRGCGPLLISKEELVFNQEILSDLEIAIPGNMTTANFLLMHALPKAMKKKEFLFSEIEGIVNRGETSLGVIIHENRFTYKDNGLKLVVDLGAHWEKTTKMPIPLGGIVANNSLSANEQREISQLILESIEIANKNPSDSFNYRKEHSAEMDEAVMRSHIDLYVNKFSIDLGEEGEKAVNFFINRGVEKGIFPKNSKLNIVKY
ncbi:MAG: 1,4-dihydroxy-6-naphthoate synthase [Sphingobacteriales bacterium]|jgi:1,4-dihydroxy-6-naphthoate synthase